MDGGGADGGSGKAEDPTFDEGEGADGFVEVGGEVDRELVSGVGFLHPAGDGVGVVLVGVAAFGGEGAVPEGGVDFCDDGAVGRRFPAVEGPEMESVTELLAEVAQPWEAGVG